MSLRRTAALHPHNNPSEQASALPAPLSYPSVMLVAPYPPSRLSRPTNKLGYVLPSALQRPTVTLLALLALTLGGTTACSSQDSQTDCSLSGCTVTFQRAGSTEASILGIKAKLIGVEGGNATLEVAGQTVTVPVGGEAAADGFTVRVDQVTDTEVVVRITP
ncbi:MAG: hypothetical protein ACRDTF_21470 [Pseudonocardiaceae bacterium]